MAVASLMLFLQNRTKIEGETSRHRSAPPIASPRTAQTGHFFFSRGGNQDTRFLAPTDRGCLEPAHRPILVGEIKLFLGMLMFPIHWTKFLHPAGVYRLEYPAHWDHVQKDEARSCGFGPHDRDDVGLWISLMPVSVDTDRLADELPKILGQVLPQMQGGNVRRDTTLRHYGVKADMHKEGEGGHYWLIAGGDVVLFASSQLPAAERHIWNPIFEHVLAALEITRDEELALRRLANEVLTLLRERHPEQDFQLDEKGIRGRNRVVFLSNVYREVRAAPGRRVEIIEHFVQSLCQSMDLPLGQESWEDAEARFSPS